MRSPTRRVAAVALAGLIVLAGCGGDDDGDDDARGQQTTTTAADDATSTTSDDDGGGGATTTTAEGSEPGDTTTEAGGSTESTAPDTSSEGQEGTGAPDDDAPDVDWDLSASQYRGRDGERIAYLCPPDGDLSAPVRGTGTYSDDSAVCVAAVHAGIINPVEGGRVVIEVAPGEDSYEGSEANDITTDDGDAADGSFTFPVG